MSDTATPPKELDGWRKLAVDLGPLVLFFAAYARFDIFVGTISKGSITFFRIDRHSRRTGF